MSGWPGGPCPRCGVYWPRNHLSCPNYCPPPRDILVPRGEKSSEAAGFYVDCPHCTRELRIRRKYEGEMILCKFCQGQFHFDVHDDTLETRAVFCNCPHCAQELRAAVKYVGLEVACRFCDGKFHLKAPELSR